MNEEELNSSSFAIYNFLLRNAEICDRICIYAK